MVDPAYELGHTTPCRSVGTGTAARAAAVMTFVAFGVALTAAGASAQVPIPTLPAVAPVTVDAKTTAILVLDETSVICAPQPACRAALPAVAALLTKARSAGALVIYTETPRRDRPSSPRSRRSPASRG